MTNENEHTEYYAKSIKGINYFNHFVFITAEELLKAN